MMSVVQATEGTYEFGIGDGSLTRIREGCFFVDPTFVCQNIVHHTRAESELMSARWVFMDVVINQLYAFDSVYDYPVFPDEDASAKFQLLFDALFSGEDLIDNKIQCYLC